MKLTAVVDEEQLHEWMNSYVESNRELTILSKSIDDNGNLIVEFDIN